MPRKDNGENGLEEVVFGEPLRGRKLDQAIRAVKLEFEDEIDQIWNRRRGTKIFFHKGKPRRRPANRVPDFEYDEGTELRLAMIRERELSSIILQGIDEPPQDVLNRIIGVNVMLRVRETKEFLLTEDKVKQRRNWSGRVFGRKRLSFAGGRRNAGEGVTRCLLRETREETGLDVRNCRFVLVGYVPILDRDEETGEFFFNQDKRSALYFAEFPQSTMPRVRKGWEQESLHYISGERLMGLPDGEFEMVSNHQTYWNELLLFMPHLL